MLIFSGNLDISIEFRDREVLDTHFAETLLLINEKRLPPSDQVYHGHYHYIRFI